MPISTGYNVSVKLSKQFSASSIKMLMEITQSNGKALDWIHGNYAKPCTRTELYLKRTERVCQLN